MLPLLEHGEYEMKSKKLLLAFASIPKMPLK